MSSLEPGEAVPPFTLRNAGPGADPLSLEHLRSDPHIERTLLLFQRDYHWTNCAKQVTAVASHYQAFLKTGTLVLSILPEPYQETRNWQRRHDLSFPVLADPDATVSEEFDQAVRFGFIGEFSDFLGRMPQAVLIDLSDEAVVLWVYRGRSTWDRPDVETFLKVISEAEEGTLVTR